MYVKGKDLTSVGQVIDMVCGSCPSWPLDVRIGGVRTMILGVTEVKWQLCPCRGEPWEGSDKYFVGLEARNASQYCKK